MEMVGEVRVEEEREGREGGGGVDTAHLGKIDVGREVGEKKVFQRVCLFVLDWPSEKNIRATNPAHWAACPDPTGRVRNQYG